MYVKLQTFTSSLLSLTGIVLATYGPTFRERCLSFKPDHYVGNSSLNVLEYIAAGTNLTLGDNSATCNRASQIVSVNVCRIALQISTSETSQITFEAWFPEDWSGRFLATGNGGIDGCIKYEDLDYGSQNRFATVGANNGHNGTSGESFLNNHETVIDFAWRSLHTSVEAGKTLIPHFYRAPHRKSYYMGCSLGGRQGIKAAELFPNDFDGILAGAPGVDFNNLISWRARFFTITGSSTSRDFIPVAAWKTWIHDEVLRQCDELDGVKDGIIEDPSLCHFNPWTLHCNSTTTTTRPKNCLSTPQIHQLTLIFTPYTYPSGTPLIFPAMQPGSEQQATEKLYAGAPFAYSADWFKYVVYSNTSWDPSHFNTTDARRAEALNPANIRTYPSSLPGFEARGGKLLMYHGQQDNQITCFNSNRFYEHLRRGSGATTLRTHASMQTWIRLFRISGMFHCSAGPGAWVLGQGGNAARKGIPFQKQYNFLAALVAWVEDGSTPEEMEGTKFVDDRVEKGVLFTRRHCMYPARNRYVGVDDKDPASWSCR